MRRDLACRLLSVEARRLGGCRIAAIVRKIRAMSDDELGHRIDEAVSADGETSIERLMPGSSALSDAELARLCDELERMAVAVEAGEL